MDVVIPGHAVRQFTAAIGCLSRIGKDLYLEFDGISGLSLRSLNDAKSAYACFHYRPNFFERCTAPPASRKRSRGEDDHDDDSDNNADEDDDTLRFSCRVALRALTPIVRPRKNVVSLRIRNQADDSDLLSFDFSLQHKDTLLTAIHRIKFADAVGVSAVASTDSASEIVASPKILLQLLEPLHRTAEAALIVRKSGSVSACSFHHQTDSSAQGANNNSSSSNNNAILQATSASLLKSETACGSDEFMEFDFVSTRDELDNEEDMPEEVNHEVILVFSIKEAKAMLQFCSQQQELQIDLNFHWGGKPVVMATSTENFSAQLVLASLDYKLLTSMRTMAGSAED